MNEEEDFSHQARVEVVKLLYQQIGIALWAESLAAISMTLVLWGKIATPWLMTWLASNLLICGFARHLLILYYRHTLSRTKLTNHNASYWLILFMAGALLSGISWGVAGSLLMVKNDLIRQTFTILLLMGVTAAANPLYSPNMRVYILFLLPAFVPFSIYLMLQGGIYIILGILACTYIFLMLDISYYTQKLIFTSFLLRFKNVGLVNNLSHTMTILSERSLDLEKSLSLVKATIESSTDGILVVNEKNKIEDFNQKFLQIWNIPDAILTNRDINSIIDFVYPQLVDPENFVVKLTETAFNRSNENFDEVLLKDGRIFERYSRPQRVGDHCVGRVWSFRDVTMRKFLEAKLFQQVNYDFLTGLPNRTLVLDRISQAVSHSKNLKLNIALLFLDLDRFKSINDTLGHTLGDKLLKAVAERLMKSVHENDTVSRGGGDEFLILLTSLRSDDQVISVARKCLAAMNESFYIDGHTFNISLSIGISFYPRDGEEGEVLIRNADIAMYRAKELGRNNFQFYTEAMNRKVVARTMMENELRKAIKDTNQFYLAYQPIVSLTTGRITGMEALLRWQHPKKGLISPEQFISVAEESGMIIPLSHYVLRLACTKAKEWHNAGFTELEMAVNVSTVQFKQANFFENIMQILQETKLSPQHLVLELTESILMDDVKINIEILHKMKRMGIRIVIDDFGVGYSSLSYLKQFPVDKLKIDRSFIQDISKKKDDTAITAAIIALANNLNLTVIAEGVENEEQLEFLMIHRCDEIQGYYFSEPLKAEQCLDILHNNIVLKLPSFEA